MIRILSLGYFILFAFSDQAISGCASYLESFKLRAGSGQQAIYKTIATQLSQRRSDRIDYIIFKLRAASAGLKLTPAVANFPESSKAQYVKIRSFDYFFAEDRWLFTFVNATRSNGLSLKLKRHSISGKKIFTIDKSDISMDTVVSVALPQDKAETVFSQLDPKEQRDLVLAITKEFNRAEFDDELAQDDKEKLREHMIESGSAYGPLLPLRAFQAAALGKKIGVCRHSAIAMAGLLLELGFPKDSVRFQQTQYHIWLEVKFQGLLALVVDPTAEVTRPLDAEFYVDFPVPGYLYSVRSKKDRLLPEATLPLSFFAP